MRVLSTVFVLVALVQWGRGYSPYNRNTADCTSYGGCHYTPGRNAEYTSSYSTSSSSTSSYGSCCNLDKWAYGHLDAIRQFANRLRQEYNSISTGSTSGYSISYKPWSESIIGLTGKTSGELDAICRLQSEQIFNDMRKGLLTYTVIAQPNFFEWKSNDILGKFVVGTDYGQQQVLDLDLSNFDTVKTYNYPAEIKVVDGKTIVVHQNVTEARKRGGEGTYENPFVTVTKRNRTVVTTNGGPAYNVVYNGGGQNYLPEGSIGGSRKKTIYDWVDQNMEPSVVNYRPVVNVDNNWRSGTNFYDTPIHIPVDASAKTEIESTDSGSGSVVHQTHYRPSSTTTVRRYNKTIITNADGTVVSGSESHKKWVDGKLVYDREHPFGSSSVPHEDEWKHRERENFFWFLNSASSASHSSLKDWQTRNEERLSALADRYHCTLEDIFEWHRKELERYFVLLGQYRAQITDDAAWKSMERGRLDWLIHQNSFTYDELERWQRENADRLAQIAFKYQITLEELKTWQMNELRRLYVYFSDQNNSMNTVTKTFASEQERLNYLIRQHNITIDQLHNSIKMEQKKLTDLSKTYQGTVENFEKWLKTEMDQLKSVISQQHDEMTRITEWQKTERTRLENIVRSHQGSLINIDEQIARDRIYLKKIAQDYHLSIEELENWQRQELERLQSEGKTMEREIMEWQRKEHESLKKLIAENHLTIEEFRVLILNDAQRLQSLASTYNVQVNEIQEWLRRELIQLRNEGFLKEVKQELLEWQQKERERLLILIEQTKATVQDLQLKFNIDKSYLDQMSANYNVKVTDIKNWLKEELVKLRSQGLITTEELNGWQRAEREQIVALLQNYNLTIGEFERKLLLDHQRIVDLAKSYNVETGKIETWIKQECERLQSLGLLKIEEQLSNWQKITRDRIMHWLEENSLSIQELELKIKNDQSQLYSLAHQHKVRVEQIEQWIKTEIQRLQAEGLLELEKLKDWQTEWRTNLINMVKQRDFTVEEFHKWLLEDRTRLQTLAMQHNVKIEEIEQWVKLEEKKFVALGLLKPDEKLTNWQEVERRYLERITQEQYQSTEQLEQRLRQDRELLEKLARDYHIQVEEVETWMKKELARLRDEGQLQIKNLTAWQIAERERLDALLKENKQWSVEEFEQVLRRDREHMERTAFQYHTSVEEIEKWIKSEVYRLQQQGKLNIEKMTQWQKEQHQRIIDLLKQQSRITAEEFELKVRKDRKFLANLAHQYHVNISEIEAFVQKVIEGLKANGKFELENLKSWQLAERDYILNLIKQHKNEWTTKQYEDELRKDQEHLRQLASYYRINIKEVEDWMIKELLRLRTEATDEIAQLSVWKLKELEKLKQIIKENSRLNYLQFEVDLKKQRDHIEYLSKKHSISVDEVIQWLREQLISLKTSGKVYVDNLSKWQENVQKRLIALCLEQGDITHEEFEKRLKMDRERLQKLSIDYNISVQEIEKYMRNMLDKLQKSGLFEFEQMSHWQKIERERLQDWLKQQNKAVTTEELEAFIARDKARIQRIAKDYQVTVEEIESYVQQQAVRLQLLGLITGSDDHISDWEFINTWSTNVTQNKQETRKEEWEVYEQNYIEQLINEKWRQQQQWSIEELERQLINDREHLQRLTHLHHLKIDQILEWYRQTLHSLLNQGKLITENLSVWQKEEKDRLYYLVIRNPYKTQEQWEKEILADRININKICDYYHATVEEVETWIRNEIKRLWILNIIKGHQTFGHGYTGWKKLEKERLRAIAAELYITEEEFLEFIAQDDRFQIDLTHMYGCTLEELAPFQKVQIGLMNREGLLDRTVLLKVEHWQREERNRLYRFIKNKSYNLNHLRNWQKQTSLFNSLAAKIGITAQELSEWQIQEFKRLQHLAQYYQWSLNQLEDFRDKELNFIAYVMHKITATEEERIQWGANENRRYEVLTRKTILQGEELIQWRRTLYLLCQARLHLVYNDNGNGPGIIPKTTISKDRGDQPPHVFEENLDNDEPGVAGSSYVLPSPPNAEIRAEPTPNYGSYDSTVRYTRKEYDYNRPNAQGSDSYSDHYKYGDGADQIHDEIMMADDNGQRQLQVEDDYGQQQQQQQIEDFSGPYAESASSSYGHGGYNIDHGQQQQQIEDFSGPYAESSSSSYAHGGYDIDHGQQQQQQLEVEDLRGSFPRRQPQQNEKQVEQSGQIEVQAEPEQPGFFGRLKNKIFG